MSVLSFGSTCARLPFPAGAVASACLVQDRSIPSHPVQLNPQYRVEAPDCGPDKPQFPGSCSAISGRRYYNPQLGRWLGRDPIEEKGGLHLYAFCHNDSINRFDRLGQDSTYLMYDPDRGWYWLSDADLGACSQGSDWDQWVHGTNQQPNTTLDWLLGVVGPLCTSAGPEGDGGSAASTSGAGITPPNDDIFSNMRIIIDRRRNADGSNISDNILTDTQKDNLRNALVDLRDNGGALGKAFYNDVTQGKVIIYHTPGGEPGGAPGFDGPGQINLDLDDPTFYSSEARATVAAARQITVEELNKQVTNRGALVLGHELGHAILGLRDPNVEFGTSASNSAIVENVFLRPALGLDRRDNYITTPIPDWRDLPSALHDINLARAHAGLPPLSALPGPTN